MLASLATVAVRCLLGGSKKRRLRVALFSTVLRCIYVKYILGIASA
jgi:hypothetical protein